MSPNKRMKLTGVPEEHSAEVHDTASESAAYLAGLTMRAFDVSAFEALCTLLRVGGMTDAGWDPFEESHKAFDDFNWLLEQTAAQRGEVAHRRVALLTYCHAVEMTAAHELLINLVRVAHGERYQLRPLRKLRRKTGKKLFGSIPPSAKRKFEEIKTLAAAAGETTLAGLIDSFFKDDVRNAYSHSDYVFTDAVMRWTESGSQYQLPLESLDRLLSNCFAFYSALLGGRLQALRALSKGRRFHQWPRFEVLELLSDADGLVYGFHIHQSNGSRSTFTRPPRANNL